MIAKFTPCSCRRSTILLTILAILACVGAISVVATDSNVAKKEHLDRSEGNLLRGFLGNRSLRTFVETTKNDDDSEERAISEAVKKIAQATKNKLTSNNQATTNKLFKKLQVKQTDEKLFRNAQFEEWVTSVTKNFKKNTELAQASMVSTLASHFGDEALAKLLVTAKQNYQSRTVATNLEKGQLQNWENAGKTGDDIFDLLKLNDKGEKLFESPVAATWMSYMARLNKDNPDEVIFSSLKKQYDDESLATMLAGTKNSADTMGMAKKLEQMQLDNWSSEGMSIDDIFKLLKLNSQRENLLQSPVLSAWISYVEFQGKNPYSTILVKLSAHYDEVGIAKMLATAKQNGETSQVARKLEEVQLKQWMGDGKSSDDVYNLLKLNLEGDNILKGPMLNTWISYTKNLGEDPYQHLLIKLMKRYDDATLTNMLVAAKREYGIGTRLEERRLVNWLNDGKTADDVFKLLQLNKEGDKLFESPVWSVWVSYLTKLGKEDSDELMFTVLKRHYGDEGVAKLATLANKNKGMENIGTKLGEELWRSQGKDGDDIFKLLKLDEEGDNFLDSPSLSTWVSYVAKLNKLDKKTPDVLLQLERRFGEMELARMIGLAKQSGATKKVVTQLQGLQFKKWLGVGVTPNDISHKVVRAEFDTRNTKVLLDYHDFWTANAARTG